MTSIHDLIQLAKEKRLGPDDAAILRSISSVLQRRPDLRAQLSAADLAYISNVSSVNQNDSPTSFQREPEKTEAEVYAEARAKWGQLLGAKP